MQIYLAKKYNKEVGRTLCRYLSNRYSFPRELYTLIGILMQKKMHTITQDRIESIVGAGIKGGS